MTTDEMRKWARDGDQYAMTNYQTKDTLVTIIREAADRIDALETEVTRLKNTADDDWHRGVQEGRAHP